MCQAPSGCLSWAVSRPGRGCGVSAQRWVRGQVRCGSECHSERADRASGLSLASALSARSRASPPHTILGAGVGRRDPQKDPLREKGRGLRVGPPSCHPAGT